MDLEEPRCDFCSNTDVKWDYPTDNFSQEVEKSTMVIEWTSIGDWAACGICHDIIEEDDREMLAARCANLWHQKHGHSDQASLIYEKIRTLHDEFFAMRNGPAKEVK